MWCDNVIYFVLWEERYSYFYPSLVVGNPVWKKESKEREAINFMNKTQFITFFYPLETKHMTKDHYTMQSSGKDRLLCSIVMQPIAVYALHILLKWEEWTTHY